jgi:hypothetical protein
MGQIWLRRSLMTFFLGSFEVWLFWRCRGRFLWKMRASVATPADQEAICIAAAVPVEIQVQ